MTSAEEIQHKQVQATYLRKLLEHVNEEIADLERAEVDPYAELKAAHAAGKRIAYLNRRDVWIFLSNTTFCQPADRYKIVEDDKVDHDTSFVFGIVVNVKFTQCALTGKITTEVVE